MISRNVARDPQTGMLAHVMLAPGPTARAARSKTTEGLVAPQSAPTPTIPLSYYGGPVQTAPVIYLVWWGPSWNPLPGATTGLGDPYSERAYAKGFLKAAQGSRWLNDVLQYPDGLGRATGNPPSMLSGSWNDTDSTPPVSPTMADFAAEALRAAQHYNVVGVNVNYVIFTPIGVVPPHFPTDVNPPDDNSLCAYHSRTTNWHLVGFAFTAMPYVAGDAYCGAGYVNSPGANDGVSIVLGHEIAETLTDPYPMGPNPPLPFLTTTGWVDANNQEIGDKCAWIDIIANSYVANYPTQPLWNNGANGCRQGPILPLALLAFTNLQPGSISTSVAGYQPSLAATGANFTNVTQVTFTWSGVTGGSKTWTKNDVDWNDKITVGSDTSMTLKPIVTAAGDPAGQTFWTVTLRDALGGSKSQQFTVTYTPVVTTALSFTDLSPVPVQTSTAGYSPTLIATGSNFPNVTQISWAWGGVTTGLKVWNKTDADWNSKVTVYSDGSMALRPIVTAANDPAGSTYWTVTLTDSTNARISRTFTVTYSPVATPTLGFTSLTPSFVPVSTIGYRPTLTALGSNFTNVKTVSLAWSGVTNGSKVWNKGDANWNDKVTIGSDNTMTLTPVVTAAGDSAGVTNWTVTLTDNSNATLSRTFTVNYTPPATLAFTGLTPTNVATSAAGFQQSFSATGSNFTNVTKVTFVWSGVTNGSKVWNRGDANWNGKVAVNSDGSLTLSPVLTAAGDPAGVTNWTVTLTDTTNASLSRQFSVNYIH